MMLFQSVNHLLRSLEHADWMASCGQAVDDAGARIVGSWEEALGIATDDYMEYFLLEQANLIRDDVTKASMEAYRKWNDLADDIRPEIVELVRRKLSTDPKRIPEKAILDHLNWNAMHAVIEVYFLAYSGRDFFQSLVSWMMKGHLGLGWESGQYPAGRAVIF
jgi:hypothetical protein